VEAAKILADAAMETAVIRAVAQYHSGHRGRCILSPLGICVQGQLIKQTFRPILPV
jgi:hypothetical protein